MAPSKHLSYSSVTGLIQCGHRHYLERIVRVPQTPAWYFIGGHVVHSVTEEWDHALLEDGIAPDEQFIADRCTKLFDYEVAQEKLVEPDTTLWRTGGIKRGKNPQIEDEAWWRAQAPVMVAKYAAWRLASADLQIWSLPDGEPAIECMYEVEIGGESFRGAIDRIMQSTVTGELLVVDLKAGKREPSTGQQLAFYRDAAKLTWGADIRYGAFYLARSGVLGQPFDLSNLTPAMNANMVAKARLMISHEIFLPNIGMLCGSCSVNPYCAAYGGTTPLPSVPLLDNDGSVKA